MVSILKLMLFLFSSFFTVLPIISSVKHHPLDLLLLHLSSPWLGTWCKNHTPAVSSNHNLTFQYIGLDEPDKSVVKSWLSKPNPKPKTSARRALVIRRLQEQSHEIIVDLSTRSIVSDKVYSGHSYPSLSLNEQIVASVLPMSYTPTNHLIKWKKYVHVLFWC
jgi:primary-amine oxidase